MIYGSGHADMIVEFGDVNFMRTVELALHRALTEQQTVLLTFTVVDDAEEDRAAVRSVKSFIVGSGIPLAFVADEDASADLDQAERFTDFIRNSGGLSLGNVGP